MVKDYDSLVPVEYRDLPHREPIRRLTECAGYEAPPKDSKASKRRRLWSRESLRTLF